MANNINPTNSVQITGQVVGVHPTKKNGLPSSYRIQYYTGFIMNGNIQVTKTSAFVVTTGELPELHDVVSLEGYLNIYNKKGENDKYTVNVNITETSREFLKKGQPPQQEERFQKKPAANNYSNNRGQGGGYQPQKSGNNKPQQQYEDDRDGVKYEIPF
jgi:hypothetical protein